MTLPLERPARDQTALPPRRTGGDIWRPPDAGLRQGLSPSLRVCGLRGAVGPAVLSLLA